MKNSIILGTAATLLLALINGILFAMSVPGLVLAALLGPVVAVWHYMTWVPGRGPRLRGMPVGVLTGVTGSVLACLIALGLFATNVLPTPLEGFEAFTVPQRMATYQERGVPEQEMWNRIGAERARVTTFSQPWMLLSLSVLAGVVCGGVGAMVGQSFLRRRMRPQPR